MKKILFFLLFVPFWATAQAPANKSVQFICTIYEAPPEADSLTLYEYVGLTARPLTKAKRTGNNVYTFTVPAGKPKFYGVGVYESNVGRVILGEEPEVKFWANANYMSVGRTGGSKANSAYEYMVKRTTAIQATSTRNADLAKVKVAYLDSLKQTNPFLWPSATLLITPHYEGVVGGNEAPFYAKNWFRYADIGKNKAYDEVPEVFFAFSNYIKNIIGLNTPPPQVREWADEQLAKLTVGSKAHRMALGGLITGCQEMQDGPDQVYFSKKYIDAYSSKSYGEIDRLRFEISKASTSTPGMEAPDLAGMTPDSSTFALRQLRGKVVLVDFWASWCGPCRKENPNVKALYAQYKDQGFEILGVSLDRDINAWRKAIADDGLAWYHISDLKQWQSSHAALYSVSSIPQTLLLDREGRIIERNLRGEGLKAKLAEVFTK